MNRRPHLIPAALLPSIAKAAAQADLALLPPPGGTVALHVVLG
ncbi:MAG TPA: hypothetical protein VFM98_18635 [Ramlibacter sp.]|nr:hypothetical protein [Ramlibacter sp.]HET8747622.1 hypothetical protein [Ramlibacter sp.]